MNPLTVYGKTILVGLLIGTVLVLVMLGGYIRDWRQEQREDRRPEIAVATKDSEKWERQIEALNLAVARLTEAQAAALATKYGRPDVRVVTGPPGPPGAPGTVVLAETKTKSEAPTGVSILTTADPKTGKVENTVISNPVPFFGMPLKWRWYVEGGVEELKMENWRAEAGVEFRALRLGWAEIQPKASIGYYPIQSELGLKHDTRLFTGVRVTFERR